jgi:hypothetical protein
MKYRRVKVAGGTYFFTVVTHDRRKFLCEPENIALLREAFRYVMNSHPLIIDAIAILPEHIHCLWTLPPEERNPTIPVFEELYFFSTIHILNFQSLNSIAIDIGDVGFRFALPNLQIYKSLKYGWGCISNKIAIFQMKIAINNQGLSLKVIENLELSNLRSHQHPSHRQQVRRLLVLVYRR